MCWTQVASQFTSRSPLHSNTKCKLVFLKTLVKKNFLKKVNLIFLCLSYEVVISRVLRIENCLIKQFYIFSLFICLVRRQNGDLWLYSFKGFRPKRTWCPFGRGRVEKHSKRYITENRTVWLEICLDMHFALLSQANLYPVLPIYPSFCLPTTFYEFEVTLIEKWGYVLQENIKWTRPLHPGWVSLSWEEIHHARVPHTS